MDSLRDSHRDNLLRTSWPIPTVPGLWTCDMTWVHNTHFFMLILTQSGLTWVFCVPEVFKTPSMADQCEVVVAECALYRNACCLLSTSSTYSGAAMSPADSSRILSWSPPMILLLRDIALSTSVVSIVYPGRHLSLLHYMVDNLEGMKRF